MERKEAIEVVKKNWPDSSRTMLREALETLIPEFAESEDKRMKRLIKTALYNQSDELVEYYRVHNITEEEIFAWLEKQGEQKSSWSEDDEAILKAIIQDIQERHPDAMWGIDTSKTAAVSTEFIIKFLKSLSPQLHWKPSEEQLSSLKQAISYFGGELPKELQTLYNDLKKLN